MKSQEVNFKDSVWSCGLAANDPDIFDETKWKGQNLLGKVLMQIRKELRNDLKT